MIEDEEQVDRDSAAQVLRLIAEEVEIGTVRGFGIVCIGGSVRHAVAGLCVDGVRDNVTLRLSALRTRIEDEKDTTVVAITDYSGG